MSKDERIKEMKQKINCNEDSDCNECPYIIGAECLLDLCQKEKEKNKEAYRKANNYLYFDDSADYGVALWEVIRTLRPDLAKKWDNGECAELEYIEEENNAK